MTTGAKRARRSGGRRARRFLPLTPFVAVLALWYLYWEIANPNLGTLPPPTRVARALWELIADGTLLESIVASLIRLVLGTVAGVASGFVLGFLVGLKRSVAEFLNPLAVFFSALGGVVWLPLAIGWFGIGTALVTFIIWNTVFFIMYGNVALGVQLIKEEWEDGLRTLGASSARVMWDVTLPGAMPYVISGIRVGTGLGWRSLITAELVGASTGLGHLIYRSAEFYRADIILGGCIVIGLIALAMDRLILAPVERRTVERWGVVTSVSGAGAREGDRDAAGS